METPDWTQILLLTAFLHVVNTVILVFAKIDPIKLIQIILHASIALCQKHVSMYVNSLEMYYDGLYL